MLRFPTHYELKRDGTFSTAPHIVNGDDSRYPGTVVCYAVAAMAAWGAIIATWLVVQYALYEV